MADDAPELPLVNIPVKPEPITHTDISDDGGLDNSLQPTDGEKPEETASEGQKTAETQPEAEKPNKLKKSPYQTRIDTLTAREQTAIRAKDEALAQAEMYKAMAEGRAEGKLAPSQAEIDRLVNARVEAKAVERQSQKVLSTGAAEYSDFTDRCNVVASLGAGERPDFLQVITDPDIIPDGHKVIAQLAENPEEAARILALPTAQMSAALVKFQMLHSKVEGKPISTLAAPIKPLDGTSRPGLAMDDRQPMSEYAKAFYVSKAKKLVRR